jgi:hypothetical protein
MSQLHTWFGDRGELGLHVRGMHQLVARFAPPHRQVRAVQPLATQQRTDRAWTRAALGLLQHAELVRGAELPALRDRPHFRASGSGDTIGAAGAATLAVVDETIFNFFRSDIVRRRVESRRAEE